MILLVDADSLIFASCYSNDKQGQFYTDIEDAINKFDQQFMKIVNDLEDRFEIEKVITFNGSKGNFRKKITPVYKANRKKQDLPPLLHDMHDYVKKQYNSVYGYGIETDDLVSAYWFSLSKDLGRENVMIVSIDKDYRQFPALIYNYHYNHREIIDITPEKIFLNIELKGKNTALETNKIIIEHISKFNLPPSKFIISSFRWDELIKFRNAKNY